MIRRPESWRDSQALDTYARFDGRALLVLPGDRLAVSELYRLRPDLADILAVRDWCDRRQTADDRQMTEPDRPVSAYSDQLRLKAVST
ncbi:hypothetical protein [Streptomyces sp. NBC_01429]|uniref:hypothetical protein n=1 Tax=Streptomyces sp. NBC_01429 TaxID=2903862 RepID=UPI002E2D8EE0|nr:hypothetical protein [Streptomyces sp. NBC_01429]